MGRCHNKAAPGIQSKLGHHGWTTRWMKNLVGWFGSEGCSYCVTTQLYLEAGNEASVLATALFSILTRDLEEEHVLVKLVYDTVLGGPLNAFKELPPRGTSAGWRKESRGMLNIQQERRRTQAHGEEVEQGYSEG